MRRAIPIVSVAAIVLLLVVTGVLVQRLDSTSNAARTAEQESQTRYDEVVRSMAEIQDSLGAIAVGDSTLAMRPPDLQTEMELRNPSRRAALDRIAAIDASIQRAKDRIRTLEVSLEKSHTKLAGLSRMLASLKRTVALKEEQVAMLSARVDSLSTEVTHGQETIAAQQADLAAKQQELATVYVTIGTKHDLTRSGVVVARGGVLGLGRTLALTGRFPGDAATPLDTDQQATLLTPAKSARVLTPQPVSSYEMRLVGDQMELHILDPVEFRKVKHLVILTS